LKTVVHKPLPETTTRMKAVGQRDTAPEIELRRALHARGVRFRACPKDLPGRPDIANKSRRWAIFVHGCFWHGHRGCKLARLPKTNTEWWVVKIGANRKRDAQKVRAMRALGFRVETVWQCQLKDANLTDELGRSLLLKAP
jgi:DNA mismatch endonuclease, patch repair protein